MTTTTRTPSSGLDRAALMRLARMGAGKASRAIAHFTLCLRIARERRQLRAFDERSLKDIGLSQVDALREAERGFWDIPDHRRAELTRKTVPYRRGSGSVPLVRAVRR